MLCSDIKGITIGVALSVSSLATPASLVFKVLSLTRYYEGDSSMSLGRSLWFFVLGFSLIESLLLIFSTNYSLLPSAVFTAELSKIGVAIFSP